ncbi:hypothetical protein AB0M02_41350 [Actinoplanes sp. NPDC051861]|uniref:hypothetical protein n=1 Tax=Actinoplanes sp. NPDC051861 TaxID=3155170 RepID=UPI00343F8292
MRRHPLVWAVPVMVVLVLVARPFNDGFYEQFVNYDPQGDDQQREWNYTRYVFQHTSGVLLGQLLCLVIGVLLARRHGQRAALAIGMPLAGVLAAVTIAAGFVLTGKRDFDLPWGVIVAELVAYPLFLAAGVGLGTLTHRTRVWAATVGGIVWMVVTVAGLMETGMYLPAWLLTAVPQLAAAAALGGSVLSADEWDGGADQSDWGLTAAAALLIGVTAWAVLLNLLAWFRQRGRRNQSAVTGPCPSR